MWPWPPLANVALAVDNRPAPCSIAFSHASFPPMSLLVVGSVAFDSVETPTEKRDNVLGGSAVFFSYAASYFTPVRLVGVVGEDWPAEHTALLQSAGHRHRGLQVVPGGKTFRWRGKYQPNMNDRETLEVHLNVFEKFDPVLPDDYRRCKFLFLANGSPIVQMKVLDQMPGRDAGRGRHDGPVDQHRSATSCCSCSSGSTAWCSTTARPSCSPATRTWSAPATRCARWAPSSWSSRRASTGRCSSASTRPTCMPAYPTPDVVDPTGAGDSFAGGMMGYLAEQGNFEPKTLKEAHGLRHPRGQLQRRGFQPRPA